MTEVKRDVDDGYGIVLGAEAREDGTRFALWTSVAKDCHVRLFEAGATRSLPLRHEGDGFYVLDVPGVGHGARYRFVLDGREVGDPYAKFLPDGVDAPAMVWRSQHVWKNEPRVRPLREHVIYELHVGTFTEEGTYAAATRKLAYLAELGVTAIELLPIAAFAGARGWGYDGVAHYASFAPYGTPDELRAFIDHAHGLGLSVLLDVVYNHFGPAGNVLHAYGPEYFTKAHTLWGEAPNFEHPAMRRYVVRNVQYVLEDLRFDGLRFDAVHAIVDASSTHILEELAANAAKLAPARIFIAEDERNDPAIVERLHFDGIWADDFHHQVHVALTGESDGYYAAYTGSAQALAETIENGWFYRGAVYAPSGKPRGKEGRHLPRESFVYCTQNHDQIGNRAFGDRLTKQVSLEAFAAAAMLLLFLPTTPLLFMGQEWGATTPFLFFTDHEMELGRAVTQGRRREFAQFAPFADPAIRERIPDPQAEETFARSRLDWNERTREEHAKIFELHRSMLALRSSDPVLASRGRDELRVRSEGDLLVVERSLGDDVRVLFLNLGRTTVVPTRETSSSRPTILLTSDGPSSWGGALTPKNAMLVAYRR